MVSYAIIFFKAISMGHISGQDCKVGNIFQSNK